MVEQLETLGGVLLAGMEPEALEEEMLTSLLNKLDDPEVPDRATTLALDTAFKRLIPRPLRRYVTGNLDDLEWRSEAGLWKEARLPVRGTGLSVSLMRLRPGEVSKHGHYGNEYTLVLAGGYKDEGRQFWPGDFAIKHSADVHQPAIDSDECTCLVVLDAPLRLTGLGEGC